MTDGTIKHVGVDGCTDGWIGIGLGENDCVKVKVCREFADLMACFEDACVILVDMPIGLRKGGAMKYRRCDNEARNLLLKRKNSVFQTPSRRFVTEVMKNQCWNQTDANNWLMENFQGKKIKKISAQAFGTIRKIGEVDEFLKNRGAGSPKKAHPEVCFWALNRERPMSAHKSEAFGFWERFRMLRCCVGNIDAVFNKVPIRKKGEKTKVATDDVLDALALAITARIGSQNPDRLGSLPENPPLDCEGLRMEMVYAKRNNRADGRGFSGDPWSHP